MGCCWLCHKKLPEHCLRCLLFESKWAVKLGSGEKTRTKISQSNVSVLLACGTLGRALSHPVLLASTNLGFQQNDFVLGAILHAVLVFRGECILIQVIHAHFFVRGFICLLLGQDWSHLLNLLLLVSASDQRSFMIFPLSTKLNNMYKHVQTCNSPVSYECNK